MEIRRTYDEVAEAYQEAVGDELAGKVLDRALLTAFAELAGPGRIADVGCGPGHVTRFLAAAGASVLGVDLSPAMIGIARAQAPELSFAVGSMLDLPAGDGAWSGVAALYSIIHLDAAERAVAFGEFARVLRPGGALLVSFHIDTPEFAAGTATHLTTWFGSPVDISVNFLDPLMITGELATAGFTLTATVIRQPLPEVEYPSRRCYLTARRA